MAVAATLQRVQFQPDRLRAARLAAGLSLRDVGARTGRHFTTARRFEAGIVEPRAGELAMLAELYGVHPGDLFGEPA
jgi:transcriptional regulator with XRE-family HTH domain